MRSFLHSFALWVCLVSLFSVSLADASSTYLWGDRYGSFDSDVATSVVVDGTGNIVMAGAFAGTVSFGGADLTSAGNSDIVIAKYSSAGAHLWSRRFGGIGPDDGASIAVDASGNIYMLARFSGTVDFGGGDLTSSGTTDIVLAKYNSAGQHQWSQRFGDTIVEMPGGVAVDASGVVHVTGYFDGTVNFGGGGLSSAGGNDVFMAQFSTAGAHQWSQSYGGTSNDNGQDIDVDGDGNVYLLGGFSGSIDIGGTILVSVGGSDMFVAKFNADGDNIWSQRHGGTSTDTAQEIALDASANVFVTGYFVGTTNLGGSNLVSNGIFDAFVVKYSSGGAHVWSDNYGGTSNEFGNAVTTDASGGVIISGLFSNDVDFGGGILTSAGGGDVFIASYDGNGTHRWSRSFGGTLADNGVALDVDDAGNVVAAGYIQDTADLGGGIISSVGFEDLFVAKYSPKDPAPAITSVADVGNDQGGTVRIRFDRAGADAPDAELPVTTYYAFRRDDPAPAAGSARAVAPPPGQLLAEGWTEVGSVSAFAETSYGIDVPTVGDSTIAGGQYYSVFYVRAATGAPSRFFDSAPDSGYSLDNLAPGTPQHVNYASTGILSWDASPAPDFDYFTVYGASIDDFGSAVLIDYTVTPLLDVAAESYIYYYVTATDFSGNESAPGAPGAVTGVGDAPEHHVLSVGAYPNPFNPSTTLRYSVPATGPVTITIHDAGGRRVATLVDGVRRTAGVYRVGWDGVSDLGGAVSSGVYFARIAQGGITRSAKIVLLK